MKLNEKYNWKMRKIIHTDEYDIRINTTQQYFF